MRSYDSTLVPTTKFSKYLALHRPLEEWILLWDAIIVSLVIEAMSFPSIPSSDVPTGTSLISMHVLLRRTRIGRIVATAKGRLHQSGEVGYSAIVDARQRNLYISRKYDPAQNDFHPPPCEM